jgi:hypothetical protein
MGSLPTPAAALLSAFLPRPALVGCAISVIISDHLRSRLLRFELLARPLQARSKSFDLLLLFQKASPLPATTPDARIVAFFALSGSTSETWSANLLAKLLQMTHDHGERKEL